MAEQAGFKTGQGSYHVNIIGTDDNLRRFAALVAAAEREACAQVCDAQSREPECPERAAYCADAIRARNEQEQAR